ncbi:MAG: protein kinase [Acidobacteriota bacterium]|nr:protein kinase [Acidobacteriota bacterium]
MTIEAGSRLGPYEIISPLGAGGMGEVYRARDRKLDRDVAIKVLPDSVAADPDALARLEREAKAVASLSHPNILAIHDFATHEGVAYVVMELLEGRTLRERLADGPVPEKQAVDYALQIARGLSAAHERGVVHRDLKPENLFVAKGGHLKILDFGLAKRVESVPPGEETSAPTESGHTKPGTVMGTVSYMSPEQAKGLPVDSRSDIFSFGAVLYEMLSGKRAFARPTSNETIAAILREEPAELSGSGRAVSPALDHIVRHCLEKDRDDRFQSAKDIAFTLSEASGPKPAAATPLETRARTGTRRALAAPLAVGLVLLSASAIFLLLRSRGSRNPEAGKSGVQRVAVLPFENLGAREDDYFADGIADAVRGKLTSVPGIEVIARASSVGYKKTSKTPKNIADELDARYLLTATVRWQKSAGGSRVQVNPELVEIKDSGAPASRWQQPFDAALTDVFQVQADIATRVAESLGLALGAPAAKSLSDVPTRNLSAYDAYLKGEDASKSLTVEDPPELRKAIAFYERAVALDPKFAPAWAQLSRASSRIYEIGTPSPETAARAREAAEKAIALAPNRPEGHLAMGLFENDVLKKPESAVEQYARGRSLSPGNAELLAGIAHSERVLGRWDESVGHFLEAERLDPRSVLTASRLGEEFLFLRRHAEARRRIERGLALAPGHLYLNELKAMSFLVRGDVAGARGALRNVSKEADRTALVRIVATYWDLVWVLDEEDRALLLRLTPAEFDNDRGTWGICRAQAYALKGDAANVKSSAETARLAIEEQLRATPEDAQRHVVLGLALAYLDRNADAIREGERGVALRRAIKDEYSSPYYQHVLARIYLLAGQPEKALDNLEPLLKIPYFLTPEWLRIDPTFDSLRGNPRFQKLVAGAR